MGGPEVPAKKLPRPPSSSSSLLPDRSQFSSTKPCPPNQPSPPTTNPKSNRSIPVSPATNKIFTASLARIYYAHPSPSEWSYTGLQGALAFTRDNTTNGCSFKLVDLQGTRGVIWEFECWKGMDYWADRSWFHTFPGDECMVGFVFADESEAKGFYKKVVGKKDAKTGGGWGEYEEEV
ncbi:hypothetical protein AAF712_007556 [Marasmius tenuissimus]|uniref:WH1 domain-containing protein n=1 Tax=Marasmius tenuissimus TaxID=585030 RepID=A0ABR2ZUX8_9AGAR